MPLRSFKPCIQGVSHCPPMLWVVVVWPPKCFLNHDLKHLQPLFQRKRRIA